MKLWMYGTCSNTYIVYTHISCVQTPLIMQRWTVHNGNVTSIHIYELRFYYFKVVYFFPTILPRYPMKHNLNMFGYPHNNHNMIPRYAHWIPMKHHHETHKSLVKHPQVSVAFLTAHVTSEDFGAVQQPHCTVPRRENRGGFRRSNYGGFVWLKQWVKTMENPSPWEWLTQTYTRRGEIPKILKLAWGKAFVEVVAMRRLACV